MDPVIPAGDTAGIARRLSAAFADLPTETIDSRRVTVMVDL